MAVVFATSSGVATIEQVNDKLTIRHRQEVEPILDAIKDLPGAVKKDSGHARRRLLGSVPVIIAMEWSTECGAAVGTPEWTAYARKKLKTAEYAYLRVFKQ